LRGNIAVPRDFLPETGHGQTHLDIIASGAVSLKKAEVLADR
jgi:hypothetical protein